MAERMRGREREGERGIRVRGYRVRERGGEG